MTKSPPHFPRDFNCAKPHLRTISQFIPPVSLNYFHRLGLHVRPHRTRFTSTPILASLDAATDVSEVSAARAFAAAVRSVNVATFFSGLGGATVAVADLSQAGCSFWCGISCGKIHDEPFVQRPLTQKLHTGAEVVVLEELSPFPPSTGEHMDPDDALLSAPRGRSVKVATFFSGLGGATVAVANSSQAGCSFWCGVSYEKIHDESFVDRHHQLPDWPELIFDLTGKGSSGARFIFVFHSSHTHTATQYVREHLSPVLYDSVACLEACVSKDVQYKQLTLLF